MSCNLFDFYKKIDSTKLDKVHFQDDPKCYYLNPYNIVGGINVYSPTLFQVIPSTKQESFSEDYEINSCSITCDLKRQPCPKDRPVVNNDCKEGTFILGDSLMTTGKVDEYQKNFTFGSGYYNMCKYTGTVTGTSQCDTLDFNKSTFIPFRCKDNKCIFNTEKNLPEKVCLGTAKVDQRCVIVSPNGTTKSPDANISSSFDLNDPKRGYMTLEVFQDLSTLKTLGDLVPLLSWRDKLVDGVGERITEKLPPSFSYLLFIISFVYSVIYLFYYQLYNTYDSNDFTDVEIMDTEKVDDYIDDLVSNNIGGSTKPPFIDNIANKDFYNNLLLLPTVSTTEDKKDFQITFTFTYNQYEENNKPEITKEQRNKYFTEKFSNMIDDGKNQNVKYIDISTGTQKNIDPATFDDIIWDPNQMKCYYFDFSNFQKDTTTVQQYIFEKSLKDFLDLSKTNKRVFLLTISSTMKIKKWS
jgi:hypothetical protein